MDNPVGAIVLAGGAARRLAGRDKSMLHLAGAPLLSRVLAAVADADVRVVVGPRRAGVEGVVWAREHPAGSGPWAALSAGLAAAGEVTRVVVLAADQPWIAPAVPALLAALDGADAAVVRQADGRRNPLASAWRADALRRALAAGRGGSLQALFEGVEVAEVADPAGWTDDIDTPADLARARARDVGAAGWQAMSDDVEPEAVLSAWITQLARALDVDPAVVPQALILDVAKDAAHNVARPAAPLTTFLVGYAAGRASVARPAVVPDAGVPDAGVPDVTADEAVAQASEVARALAVNQAPPDPS